MRHAGMLNGHTPQIDRQNILSTLKSWDQLISLAPTECFIYYLYSQSATSHYQTDE